MLMDIKFLTVFWIINLNTAQQINESISFSPISSKFSNSYWHGSLEMEKEAFFLEEGISLHISLNKYQGLLFYAIDNSYRTLCVEFIQDSLEISYYHFKIKSTDKRTLKISDSKINKNGNEFNMTFHFVKNEIIIQSNGKNQTIDYYKPQNPLLSEELDMFRESFDLPIPIFNNSKRSSEVFIWIGNTPSTKDTQQFQNIAKLRSNFNTLWGCIMFFTIKHVKLKLATSGNRVGEMIRPYCKPTCNSSSCSNNGHCYDLWNGQFDCDCGLSKYIGKYCKTEHSIKFDGSFAIEGNYTVRLQKLRFTFNVNLLHAYGGFKLLSLRFSKNQYFQVYIDSFVKLHVSFISNGQNKLGKRFSFKMVDLEEYSFFAEIILDKIHMKIYNSFNMKLIETQLIQINQLNLIVEDIIVGGSHIDITDGLKNFRGCFSNLILTSAVKDYTWDQMEKFKQYPKCVYPSVFKTKSLLTEKRKTEESAISNEKPVKNVVHSYTAYILIAVVSSICLLIILIMVIVIKFHSRKSNKNPTFHIPEKFLLDDIYYNPKDSFNTYKQNEIFQNEDLTDSAPYHVYPAPIYMTYKPAYKAKSLCSSITNRSLISLPVSPTPTLATPEDGEGL